MGPSAVIEVAFDPILRLFGLEVRWTALGVAAAILAAFLLAAFMADRSPPRSRRRSAIATMPAPEEGSLRREDLLLIGLAALAGGVLGGRIAHGLAFWDVYSTDPLGLFDPARGSLSLLGAVVGGSLTAAYLATLLEGSLGRWADVAAAPLLLALGLGKVAQFLGGGGQGTRFEGPWAVSFAGQGPWLSRSPGVSAHPSQLYEAAWCLLGLVGLLVLGFAWRRGRTLLGPGLLFAFALAWWLVGRVVIGFTWRDDRLFGAFNAEQVMALLCLTAVGVIARLALVGIPFRRTRDF